MRASQAPNAATSLGKVIRQRRAALGFSLNELARRAGCAASYLSAIENQRRAYPPGEAILDRLERALELPRGRLRETAEWERTPRQIRREFARLARKSAAGERGPWAGGLDALYKSGELRRLVDRLAPEAKGAAARVRDGRDAVEVSLPRRVPLINSVAAGTPAGFTDLDYPARVADQYVAAPEGEDPDLFAARVVGDSMLPEYREGDIVIFSPARQVASGMDCFARLEPDHETTFKRVVFETGAGGEALIRLQPLNPAYPARVVAREQVAGLYAAVSVLRAIG